MMDLEIFFTGGVMNPIFYYDGKLCKADEAAIPMTDRSVFFGDAVYDACLVKNGKPYLLDAHLDRFCKGCGSLGIRPPMTKNELRTLLCSLCALSECEIAFLYFQASRAAPLRRHFAMEEDTSHLLVTISEGQMPSKEKALRLLLLPDRRYDFCHIKTVNLLPAVLAATKAKKAGADEAVFVRDGVITECAHSNVSILKNGTLFTHPKSRRILPGIQRAQLISACKRLCVPICETPFSEEALLDADEIFITSTTRLCQRAYMINGRTVGQKGLSLALRILDEIFSDFEKI